MCVRGADRATSVLVCHSVSLWQSDSLCFSFFPTPPLFLSLSLCLSLFSLSLPPPEKLFGKRLLQAGRHMMSQKSWMKTVPTENCDVLMTFAGAVDAHPRDSRTL